MLGDEDLGPLYDLLIDESPLIRHAVGDLVYDHLIAQKFSSAHATGISLPWSSHLCIIILVENNSYIQDVNVFLQGLKGRALKCRLAGSCRSFENLHQIPSSVTMSLMLFGREWMLSRQFSLCFL